MSQEYDLRQPSPWYNLATAALGLAALFAAAQAFAQDETANPNVIVDYGVLDELTDETTSASGETLPAPASKPVSRMLMSSDGSPITISDSSESMDETVSSVPTTPIESTNLTGDGTDAVETALDDSDLAAAAGDATDATDAEATDEAVAAAAETAMATALIEGQVRIAFEPGSDAIPETALGEINGLIRKM
ncbi:MAG: hypothetical protein ACREEE_12485, partial [Dongiaceae bacterium]